MTNMQPPQQYQARLEDRRVFNDRYTLYSFELVKPNQLQFAAGQYISLKINEQGHRRSYSISNTPDQNNQVQTIVDHLPDGPGAEYLRNLQFGDSIEFLAPLGRFTVPLNLAVGHLVFVATGSGISPFKSMIEDLLRNQHDQRQITLHWGMRRAEHLFLLDEWRELMDAFPNFHFHPVLSQAPDEWSLCRGRVTDCLSVHGLPQNAAYFLCGNQSMIQDVTQLLTAQKQVDEELLFTEKFY